MPRLVEMVVESVRVHMLTDRHVVILKDATHERYLPIWIGRWEASAIAMRLQGFTPERPLTHDLFAAALEGLGARVDRVVIVSLAEETYHARILLDIGGREVELDARPSDAIALAVRGDVRIYADEAVLDMAALGARPETVDDEGEEVASRSGIPGERRPRPVESIGDAPADPRLDLFREFINSLDMEPGAGGPGGPGGEGGRRS